MPPRVLTLASLLLSVLFAGGCAQSHPPSPAPVAALPQTITYTNSQYGFRFVLPLTWTGYTVLSGDTWRGTPIGGEPQEDSAKAVAGPLLRLRNPRWSQAKPYEDIPIMIFTLARWSLVEQDKLATGAAPFPPSELGRNERYVFALPPRYNFDYALGWEEVEKIMGTRPLHATP